MSDGRSYADHTYTTSSLRTTHPKCGPLSVNAPVVTGTFSGSDASRNLRLNLRGTKSGKHTLDAEIGHDVVPSLTCEKLKDELAARGEGTQGVKSELIDRLQNSILEDSTLPSDHKPLKDQNREDLPECEYGLFDRWRTGRFSWSAMDRFAL